MKDSTKKILISSNTIWSLLNFRLNLIKSLIRDGYVVIAAAAGNLHQEKLESIGCKFIELPIKQKGKGLFDDARLIYHYIRLMHKEKPQFYFAFTIKPNIYGSLAALYHGIPYVNNIAGLGIVFLENNFLTMFVKFLYKISLARSKKIFFQNNKDQELFKKARILRDQPHERLPGSGVDLNFFQRTSLRITQNESIKFLMATRLLRQKGVFEYVEAARLVRQVYSRCEFVLMGYYDESSLHEINPFVIGQWERDRIITFKQASDDIKSEIEQTDCVVLPSYYPEGVPRILLEASSMTTPIITTNNRGCIDAVEDKITGFIAQKKNPHSLAEKMIEFIKLGPELRSIMGRMARLKMEQEFDEKIIINAYKDFLK